VGITIRGGPIGTALKGEQMTLGRNIPTDADPNQESCDFSRGRLSIVLCEEVQRLLGGFQKTKLSWVPREKNKQADKLSNMAFQSAPPKKQFTGEIKKIADHVYIAYGTEPYAVDILHEACTCPAFVTGKTRPCKHLIAIISKP